MNEFLALVGDTWRQSRHQVVLTIMIILLALVALVGVLFPGVEKTDSGEDQFCFWMFSDEPTDALSSTWIDTYASTLVVSDGAAMNPFEAESSREFMEKQNEARQRARELSKDVPLLQKSLEIWVWVISKVIFSVALAFFIAACAGYFPNLLAAGAIDVVLAKPITRFKILMGKYLGGLVLFSLAIFAANLILFVGLGLRTGFWPIRLFLSMPMTIFSAAVLYAMLTYLGVLWRSTAFSMIVGYFFFYVIDLIIGSIQQFQMIGMFRELGWEWVDKAVKITRYTVPNFDHMKETAVNSVLNMPAVQWTPMIVAGAWLVVFLGLSYWTFRRRDY